MENRVDTIFRYITFLWRTHMSVPISETLSLSAACSNSLTDTIR